MPLARRTLLATTAAALAHPTLVRPGPGPACLARWPADRDRRPLRARWWDGRHGACHRALPRGPAAGRPCHRLQQARRRRPGRHGGGGQCRAGRLHPRRLRHPDGPQPADRAPSPLAPGRAHLAGPGRRGPLRPFRPHRQPAARPARPAGGGPQAAGRPRLRHRGHRRGRPHRRAAAGGEGGRPAEPHPFQRHLADPGAAAGRPARMSALSTSARRCRCCATAPSAALPWPAPERRRRAGNPDLPRERGGPGVLRRPGPVRAAEAAGADPHGRSKPPWPPSSPTRPGPRRPRGPG